jgi:hypothetical protein
LITGSRRVSSSIELLGIRFKAYQFINRTVFVLLGLVGLDIQSIYGYTRYLISIFLLLVEVFPYCIQYYTNTIPYNHTCFKACAARLRVQPVRVFEEAGWCPSVTAPKDTWLIFRGSPKNTNHPQVWLSNSSPYEGAHWKYHFLSCVLYRYHAYACDATHLRRKIRAKRPKAYPSVPIFALSAFTGARAHARTHFHKSYDYSNPTHPPLPPLGVGCCHCLW